MCKWVLSNFDSLSNIFTIYMSNSLIKRKRLDKIDTYTVKIDKELFGFCSFSK